MDVRSFVTLSANAPKARPEQLPAPEYVAAVRSIPNEITGFERRYLEALQKNVMARKEYNVALDYKSAQQPNLAQVDIHGTHLSDHVGLLKLKARRQQLRILQKYLTRLKQTDTAKADFLDLKKVQRYESNCHSPEHQHSVRDIFQGDESVDALVRRLEVVVIRAKHQVDRERRLLEEVEKNAAASPLLVKQKSRPRALAATRDELVAWIEGNLSESFCIQNSVEDDLQQRKQADAPILRLQSEIMNKYEKYIEARQRMLQLVSMITRATRQPPAEQQLHDSQTTPRPAPHQPITQSLLPFVSTQIKYPARLHQLHRQQTSYLNTITKKIHSKTASELSRLAYESHLLPSYPMLAQQCRLKHAVAAIAPKPPCSEAVASDGEVEIDRRVEAWVFAADAAKEATGKIVSGQLESAGKAAEAGKRWLARLRELLGDGVEVGQNKCGSAHGDREKDDGKEADEDVWALEATAGPFAGRKWAGTESKGPWMGLYGNVGPRKPP
jgi:hypothetical protein